MEIDSRKWTLLDSTFRGGRIGLRCVSRKAFDLDFGKFLVVYERPV